MLQLTWPVCRFVKFMLLTWRAGIKIPWQNPLINNNRASATSCMKRIFSPTHHCLSHQRPPTAPPSFMSTGAVQIMTFCAVVSLHVPRISLPSGQRTGQRTLTNRLPSNSYEVEVVPGLGRALCVSGWIELTTSSLFIGWLVGWLVISPTPSSSC